MRLSGFGLLLLGVVGCGGAGQPQDIVGPYSGSVRRFRVDQLTLPPLTPFAADDDLDGDGRLDDQLAHVDNMVTTLALGEENVADLIASGVIASFVELQSDDATLANDPSVGVRFLGADGDTADVMGGALVAGQLTTNRIRFTEAPARSTVRLPLFSGAEPVVLELIATELELSADGQGGWNGKLQGAALAAGLPDLFFPPFLQAVANTPSEQDTILRLFDTNLDGQVEAQEFTTDPIVEQLLGPDVQLFQKGVWAPTKNGTARDSFSLALELHLVPAP